MHPNSAGCRGWVGGGQCGECLRKNWESYMEDTRRVQSKAYIALVRIWVCFLGPSWWANNLLQFQRLQHPLLLSVGTEHTWFSYIFAGKTSLVLVHLEGPWSGNQENYLLDVSLDYNGESWMSKSLLQRCQNKAGILSSFKSHENMRALLHRLYSIHLQNVCT